MNYYNDNDPFVAKWLKNLVTAGHLPAGDVDERSITEVTADDLKGYRQVHFFAGIGGWPLALRLAGWPDDRPAWTGSCPCQPLSSAGQRKGHADERHLWPAFQSLIAECRPSVVFGEQVASRDGREWLAAVRTDLESMGYACGVADLSAAGVGAPHIRQRLWWLAHDQRERPYATKSTTGTHVSLSRNTITEDGGNSVGVADGNDTRHTAVQSGKSREIHNRRAGVGTQSGLECSDATDGLADAGSDGRTGTQELRPRGIHENGQSSGRLRAGIESSNATDWRDLEWIACADGKARPTQPGIHPLADGILGRVGQLRAYGNAIVPPLAAVFIKASMEAMKEAT